jgi:hypothetical protein
MENQVQRRRTPVQSAYRVAEIVVGILFLSVGFITGNFILGLITGGIGIYLLSRGR